MLAAEGEDRSGGFGGREEGRFAARRGGASRGVGEGGGLAVE